MSFLTSIIDFIFKLMPQPALTPDQIGNVKLVAHRGYHGNGIIENTLDSFIWCLENDIWGIEIDIHFTADNIPVVHHDPHCGRLFNKPHILIARSRFEDLKSQIPDIPSLEEVVRICGKKIHLMIELKTHLNQEQNQIFSNILSGLRSKVDYHILSLDLDHFRSVEFLKYDSFLPVAELKFRKFIKFAIEKQCAGVAGHYLLLSRSTKRRLSSSQINTGVGFIASKNSLKREIRRNHDWIFTDKISRTSNWIKQLS